jgi:hypothetical protein
MCFIYDIIIFFDNFKKILKQSILRINEKFNKIIVINTYNFYEIELKSILIFFTL